MRRVPPRGSPAPARRRRAWLSSAPNHGDAPARGEDAAQGRVGGSVHHEHLADELAVAQLGSPVPGGLQQLGADTTALPAVDDLDGELPAPVADVDDPHDADRTALGEGRKRNMRAIQRGQAAAGGSRELGDRDLEAQVAAVWGQSGEDLVDDVAVAGAKLADADEVPDSGGVKLGILANSGAVGAAGSGGVNRIFPSRGPGAFPRWLKGARDAARAPSVDWALGRMVLLSPDRPTRPSSTEPADRPMPIA